MADRNPPAIPTPGSYRPGVANVRIDGPPEVVDAACALLSDLLEGAWQASTRKPSRHAGGGVLQYGTLIVPVPKGGTGAWPVHR